MDDAARGAQSRAISNSEKTSMALPSHHRHPREHARRVRELEQQLARTVRELRQALVDLDAACAHNFDAPRAVRVDDVPRDPRAPDGSGWQPPAMDSDEADEAAAAFWSRRHAREGA